MRSLFNKVLVDIARQDDRIWMILADIGYGEIEPFRDKQEPAVHAGLFAFTLGKAIQVRDGGDHHRGGASVAGRAGQRRGRGALRRRGDAQEVPAHRPA